MNKKILVVAAHPDDEVLGCGGAVARLIKEGYTAYSLILGDGVTSRGIGRKKSTALKIRRNEMQKANKLIGIKKVFYYSFPDNAFDSVPLLKIVKTIEIVKKKISPEIIFTHFENDLNIDHVLTYKAVVTATRPMKDESVKEIYSFEIPSSTEWNYPLSFSPNVFFNIKNTLKMKIDAMEKYASEIRQYPHPRSPEFLKLNAKYWGARVGVESAEVFKLVRIIK